jgi:hypothetical protein
MNVQQFVELADETEALGESLPQCHSVHHTYHPSDLPWHRIRATAIENRRLTG